MEINKSYAEGTALDRETASRHRISQYPIPKGWLVWMDKHHLPLLIPIMVSPELMASMFNRLTGSSVQDPFAGSRIIIMWELRAIWSEKHMYKALIKDIILDRTKILVLQGWWSKVEVPFKITSNTKPPLFSMFLHLMTLPPKLCIRFSIKIKPQVMAYTLRKRPWLVCVSTAHWNSWVHPINNNIRDLGPTRRSLSKTSVISRALISTRRRLIKHRAYFRISCYSAQLRMKS